jgi:hypothetical protein
MIIFGRPEGSFTLVYPKKRVGFPRLAKPVEVAGRTLRVYYVGWETLKHPMILTDPGIRVEGRIFKTFKKKSYSLWPLLITRSIIYV